MYVCICHGVTDRAIRTAAESGVRDVADLAMDTGLGTGCGTCTGLAQQLLDAESQRLTLPADGRTQCIRPARQWSPANACDFRYRTDTPDTLP